MKKSSNSLRIIGGKFRGKKIHFPDALGLRPTTDRIRETLFNWLMHDLPDARCLDLFAGSGALGFEAQSRGAAQVVLIEKNPLIVQQLQQTAAQFDADKIAIVSQSARTYLQTQPPPPPFDIIFVDPPFAHPELFDCIQIIEQSTMLKPQGLLYVEAPQERPLKPHCWQRLKLKTAGHITFALYAFLGNA